MKRQFIKLGQFLLSIPQRCQRDKRPLAGFPLALAAADPYHAGTSSLPSLGPPVLLGWANSKGLKLALPLSCPVAAVCLLWDCCRAESCRSFCDDSLLHQPQRWGETVNGQQGVELPTLPWRRRDTQK